MIQLTLPWIKNYAQNDRRFRDGFLLYQKDGVIGVEARSKNGLTIKIKDKTETTYSPTVYFYKDTGTFKYAKCTCRQGQPCEHVIGALLYILYKKESLTDTLAENETQKMFDSFQEVVIYSSGPNHKRLLALDVIFHPRNAHSNTQSTGISLKIHFHNSYLVKNIEHFVDAVVHGKSYECGKQLTYSPNQFFFDETDLKVIHLLYDYYQTRSHMAAGLNTHTFTSLKSSYQQLPSTYVGRLLDILVLSSFHIDYDGLFFKSQDIASSVEVDFYMQREADGYLLSVNTYDVFFPLTTDFSYVFYNNQISSIDCDEKEAFKLMCHYLADKSLLFEPDQIEDYINKIHPVFELIGYVHLDEDLKTAIETYPLKSSLYIEKDHDQVCVKLTHEYGPYKFNPLVEDTIETDGFIYIRRNLEKEAQIDRYIYKPKHTIEKGKLIYANEEALFIFVDTLLPKLSSLCNIYYSDDFKTTYLKSQKKLVSTIQMNQGNDFLTLDFELEDVSPEELRALLAAVQEKKHYYKLKDGSFFNINNQLIEQVTALDRHFGLRLEDGPLIETSLANAFYLNQLMDGMGIASNYDKAFQRIISDLSNYDAQTVQVPATLSDTLRDYQKTGFRWLEGLRRYHLGGILADDMGLGKTLQAITLILKQDSDLPTLVVAPTSLIYNWEEEIHKFAPSLHTKTIVGTKNARMAQIKSIAPKEVIITSYGSLKRDMIHYDVEFEFCIIDEAQHIKNPKSLNAQVVKKVPSKHRYALTGTPIENTLTELWSIFDFILPNYLLSHEHFMKQFERPIVKEHDIAALTQLNQLTKPFILRRLKEDVLTELPPKIESKVSVELSTHQKKLYTAYVQQAKNDVSAYSHLPGGQRNMKILSVLTRLRQLCCHPSLFIGDYNHGSSKLDLLLELLQDSIEGGHRVLVFSQFTSMLGIIQDVLDKHHIDYFYIDGSVPPIKRQQMVHDFNNGLNDVFLISLKAGGTGLNLTGADVVIHYDPWWNPAVENQATDRAYRIGQKNRVQVYKLITAGTIEEKIYQLQQKKHDLIDSVIKPGETFIQKLSTNELESLFEDYRF